MAADTSGSVPISNARGARQSTIKRLAEQNTSRDVVSSTSGAVTKTSRPGYIASNFDFKSAKVSMGFIAADSFAKYLESAKEGPVSLTLKWG